MIDVFRWVEHPLLAPAQATLVAVRYDAQTLDVEAAQRHLGALPTELAYAVDKRKAEYLAGRYCARRALHALGIDGTSVPQTKDRAPVWPAGVVGSITHTRTYAAAVVGRADTVEALGLDTEPFLDSSSLQAVQDLVVNAAEKTLIASQPLPDACCFAVAFSAKESLFKALYASVKHFFDFDAATVSAWHPHKQTLVLVLQQDLSRTRLRGHAFEIRYQIEECLVHTMLELPRAIRQP